MWHLTLATDGRMAVARGEAELREQVRAVVAVGRGRVLLFCVVDDHVHVVFVGMRIDAGRYANGLRRALRVLTTARLEPARIRSVNGRGHLLSLIRYVVSQPLHHGLARADALAWSGSCLADLLGARELGAGLTGALQVELPRWTPTHLLRELDLPVQSVDEVPLERVRELGAARLAAAAAAAFGAPPDLTGERPYVRAARAAFVQVGTAAGIAASELAFALDVHVDSIRRLARRPASDTADRLVRRRLWLEEVLAGAPATDLPAARAQGRVRSPWAAEPPSANAQG